MVALLNQLICEFIWLTLTFSTAKTAYACEETRPVLLSSSSDISDVATVINTSPLHNLVQRVSNRPSALNVLSSKRMAQRSGIQPVKAWRSMF